MPSLDEESGDCTPTWPRGPAFDSTSDRTLALVLSMRGGRLPGRSLSSIAQPAEAIARVPQRRYARPLDLRHGAEVPQLDHVCGIARSAKGRIPGHAANTTRMVDGNRKRQAQQVFGAPNLTTKAIRPVLLRTRGASRR